MKANLILADFAQTADNKLTVVGAGWDHKGQQSPMGVGILIRVPWTATNQKHRWRLWLEDSDGHPVSPDGENRVEVHGEFELGRPPGVPAGWELTVPLAINVGPLPLTAGSSYSWILEIDGSTDEDWRVTFRVKS